MTKGGRKGGWKGGGVLNRKESKWKTQKGRGEFGD